MPVFRKSRKKEIGMEDLYSVLKVHKSDGLGDQMCDAWEREVIRAKKKDKEPSLLRATLSVFGWKLTFIGIILAVIEFLLRWVAFDWLHRAINPVVGRSVVGGALEESPGIQSFLCLLMIVRANNDFVIIISCFGWHLINVARDLHTIDDDQNAAACPRWGIGPVL